MMEQVEKTPQHQHNEVSSMYCSLPKSFGRNPVKPRACGRGDASLLIGLSPLTFYTGESPKKINKALNQRNKLAAN